MLLEWRRRAGVGRVVVAFELSTIGSWHMSPSPGANPLLLSPLSGLGSEQVVLLPGCLDPS